MRNGRRRNLDFGCVVAALLFMQWLVAAAGMTAAGLGAAEPLAKPIALHENAGSEFSELAGIEADDIVTESTFWASAVGTGIAPQTLQRQTVPRSAGGQARGPPAAV